MHRINETDNARNKVYTKTAKLHSTAGLGIDRDLSTGLNNLIKPVREAIILLFKLKSR